MSRSRLYLGVLGSLLVCVVIVLSFQGSQYFVCGKAITGVRGDTCYTIAVEFYDDTGVRLIVKDREFNFTELVLNDTVKRKLREKYSRLNYILMLFDGDECAGYFVNEEDFMRAELGSIVEAKVIGTNAKILKIVEKGVKPFYVLNGNESKAKELWRKVVSLVNIRYPFSGIVFRHICTTGGGLYSDWYVIVTMLDFKNLRVNYTILRFDDSFKLVGNYKFVRPLMRMSEDEISKSIDRTINRYGLKEFFRCKSRLKRFGWYYVYRCPSLGGTIVFERHSGLVFLATKRLMFPEMYREICKTDRPPELMVKMFLPDINRSWKMIDSDYGCTRSISVKVPRIAEVLHVFRFSEKIKFNPLVENGTIFVACEKNVYAIDERTGNMWVLNLSPNCYALGDYLYLANSELLLAIDKRIGKIVWTANVCKAKSILIVEGYIIVATPNVVSCLSKNDGKVLWSRLFRENVSAVCAGDGKLFVANGKEIRAFKLSSGEIVWKYEHWCKIKRIAYKDGRLVFVNSVGNVAVLDENGNYLWEKDAGVDEIAIDKAIYASKILGKKGLVAMDFNGNTIFTFDLPDGEIPGAPIVTDNVVVLPSMKPKSYGKVYILGHNGGKLFELKHDGKASERPKVSVAYGKIYTVFQYDEEHYAIYVLGDSKPPEVIDGFFNVTEVFANQPIHIWVNCKDNSGIYKAIFAYRVNDTWRYIEMDTNSGFRLPSLPAGSMVDYAIILIDNVGNYRIIEGRYRVI